MKNLNFDDDYINLCNLLEGYCLGKLKEGNTHCRECISYRLNTMKEEYSEIMGNEWPLFNELENKESKARPAPDSGTPCCCIKLNVADTPQEKCLTSGS